MPEENKIIDKYFNKKAKRTTIILENNEREFIDQIIRDGKEPGIKPLISKMLDIYKNLTIYDWHFPGEYYYGISRIALVNIELINTLIQQIPQEKWLELGAKIGEITKVSIETNLGIQSDLRENWEKVFSRLKIQGFGDFILKDKYILVKTPFINESEIWSGILGTLLNVDLETKTPFSPIVFEIKERQKPEAKRHISKKVRGM